MDSLANTSACAHIVDQHITSSECIIMIIMIVIIIIIFTSHHRRHPICQLWSGYFHSLVSRLDRILISLLRLNPLLSTPSHHILLLITMITIIALISLITIISIITTIIRYLVSLQVWSELLASLLLINIIATINLVNCPNRVPQQNGFDHPTDIQIYVSWGTQLSLKLPLPGRNLCSSSSPHSTS